MQILSRVLRGALLAVAAGLLPVAHAETIQAKYPEGTVHGFLALSDSDGKTVAAGDIIQIVHGDRVSTHIVYRFKDGSVDDEATVFTQRGVFHLISDHHIQKGPFFPHPMDVMIDALHSTVTYHTTDKDGKDQTSSSPMKLPPDLYNGLVGSVVKNVPSTAPATHVSLLVMAPKPRIVKLAITQNGEDTFSLAGTEHKAHAYDIKIEIGGLVGMVAPLVGKSPPDIQLWVDPGEVPVIIRESSPLFDGSPILTMNLISPVWPHDANKQSGN